MQTKTLLTAATAAAALALTTAAPAHAALSLFVNYSDDASAFIQANPGDQFFLNGTSGGLTLFDGVTQTVDAGYISENLTCCYWDDAPYSTTVNHTLTLNGVGGGFSQLWQIGDYFSPSSFLSGAGPVVYKLAGNDQVTVNMNPTYGFGAYTAGLTFQSGAPEPAAWALMLTGFFGAGAVLRANRRRTAVAAA